MATDAVEIFNLAVNELGGNTFTSGDDSQADILYDQFYTVLRDSLLERYDWNFARAFYHIEDSDTEITVTGITAATPPVVSATAHGLVTGNYATFRDVNSDVDGTKFQSTLLTANTYSLQTRYGTDVVGTGFGSISSGGKMRQAPSSAYNFLYPLPSDYITDRWEENNIIYEFETQPTGSDTEAGTRYLVTNADEITLAYTSKITDTTLYPVYFVDALVANIKKKIVFSLTGKADLIKPTFEIATIEFNTAIFEAAKTGNRAPNKKTSGKETWAEARRYRSPRRR